MEKVLYGNVFLNLLKVFTNLFIYPLPCCESSYTAIPAMNCFKSLTCYAPRVQYLVLLHGWPYPNFKFFTKMNFCVKILFFILQKPQQRLQTIKPSLKSLNDTSHQKNYFNCEDTTTAVTTPFEC